MVIYILATFPLPSKRALVCASCCLGAESLFVAAFLISTSLTYYSVVTNGMNMDGFRGYVMTLVPTIPISIFIWIIKKKYLAEKVMKMEKRRLKMAVQLKRCDSLSTEEEMIFDSDMSES